MPRENIEEPRKLGMLEGEPGYFISDDFGLTSDDEFSVLGEYEPTTISQHPTTKTHSTGC